MKELPIDMDELALQLDRPREFPFDVLLDLETGEIIQLAREDADYVPDDDEELRQKVEAQPERYEEVPMLGSDEAYRFMERFAVTRSVEADRQAFLNALDGKGPFGRFRDAVRRANQDDDWHRFRDEQFELHVRKWLEGLGLTAPPTAPRR